MFGQPFGKVGRIAAEVAIPVQELHALFERIGQGVSGLTTPIPMSDGWSTSGLQRVYLNGGRLTMTAALALLIFVLTLVFVIRRPRRIGIGWSAAAGASLALATGVVTAADALKVVGIVWNATLAFVAVVLISLVLDEIGFFEWAALHVARLAGGDGRTLFALTAVLCAAVSAFLTNDGAALMMTPIVLAIVRELGFAEKTVLAFALMSGFVADATSLPLVVSNLTNMIAADVAGVGFSEYAARMWVPDLVSLAVSLAAAYVYFRGNIPARYRFDSVRAPETAIRDAALFRKAWVVLAVLAAAYVCGDRFGVPVSLVAGAAAVWLLWLVRRSPAVAPKRVVRNAPWAIIAFAVGMYVVVYGLRNAGLTEMLGSALVWAAERGTFVAAMTAGWLAAVLSSVMNNLPTVMVMALAVKAVPVDGAIREALIYSNVIGSDIGPKMTPIGSLATLIWLHVLARKGLRVGWREYVKVGVALTVPTLTATLVALTLWLQAVHTGRSAVVWAVLVAALCAGSALLVRQVRKSAGYVDRVGGPTEKPL